MRNNNRQFKKFYSNMKLETTEVTSFTYDDLTGIGEGEDERDIILRNKDWCKCESCKKEGINCCIICR